MLGKGDFSMKMQMEMSYVIAVVITGLVVVFLGLVLLIAFITLVGKIFEKIDKSKAAKKSEETAPVPAPSAAPAVQAAAGDSDEIIAVISAAVAMMSAADGKPYRIRSVKPAAGKGSSRSAWAAAGLRDYTDPF